MSYKKKELSTRERDTSNNTLARIIDAGQSLVIDDMANIYDEIMSMSGKSKVESYLKFAKFFFVELPQSVPKETDMERIRRETMEITDKFSENIQEAEEV